MRPIAVLLILALVGSGCAGYVSIKSYPPRRRAVGKPRGSTHERHVFGEAAPCRCRELGVIERLEGGSAAPIEPTGSAIHDRLGQGRVELPTDWARVVVPAQPESLVECSELVIEPLDQGQVIGWAVSGEPRDLGEQVML